MLEQGEFLPMAALAPRILAAALLEGDHLLGPRLLEHLGGDRCAGDLGVPSVMVSPPTTSTSPNWTMSPLRP